MNLSVKKTDYRFSANNMDYLPETNECEQCGDFCDDDHIYDFNGEQLCSKCFNKEVDAEELYLSEFDYELNGGTK
jgi:formylmethanofuran dehydrogenase subunit E